MTRNFDAIVIGGGSGGVAFSRKAGVMGASVCLIEKNLLGGTCINRGCVPKKLMWQATWTHERARAACEQGLAPVPPRPDFAKLQERISDKLSSIRQSYAVSLDQAGVTVLEGEAALTGPREVMLNGEKLTAEKIVLATGATPQLADIEGIDRAETSDDIFGWQSLPKSLALLGAGYIGSEFASIFRGLGVEVHLIDADDGILSGFDSDMTEIARDILGTRGVELHLGDAPNVIRAQDGGFLIKLQSGKELNVERVVAATGRAPRTDLPGGMTDTLEIARTGAFAVDDGLQTSQEGIYALGDCADRLPLTPVATRDGDRLAQRLFGKGMPALIDLSLVAQAAFTMPPIAQVGKPDDAVNATGADLSDGVLTPERHWTTVSARKVARGGPDGLLGVAALGFGAPDIVTALGAALEGSDAAASTGIHPTTAEEYIGRA
ncbi:MAG: FAD-dependent oxidoreductase [Sulfitobacter sp.]|nr:FAD-dependent oxidoreductase [Sulfitobacter sp.]